MAVPKKFTYAEIRALNVDRKVWIVIDDKVYNISSFLEEHPGGADVLIEVAGKDATKEFEEVGHSEAAREQMKDYYAGDIVDAERKKNSCGKKLLASGLTSAAAVGLGVFLAYTGYKILKN